MKARAQLIRDLGCLQSPQNALYLNLGLETMPLRMERYHQNALQVAKFLQNHPQVLSVNYPNLESSPSYKLAQKYLREGKSSGVLSFVLKGGFSAGAKFIDALKLVRLEVHVADIRSCVLHPASTSHRQLTPEQLKNAGVDEGLVRLSVGLENIEDIIADLEQALAQL